MLKRWEELPDFMRIPEVRPYWEALWKKRAQLMLKRILDICGSLVLLVPLSIPMAIIAVWIKLDSPGTVLYRQKRVTSYGKHFSIHKFRTMVPDADLLGTTVTVSDDSRITRAGSKLRKFRLDEFPQVFDVLTGNMSFVGTRPEAVKYVKQYNPEYNATLLLPAGITSEASIRFKNEDSLLNTVFDIDKVYIEEVLPQKMKWNLKSVSEFSIAADVVTLFRTVAAVMGKDYE